MPKRLPSPYTDLKDISELRRYLDELVRELEDSELKASRSLSSSTFDNVVIVKSPKDLLNIDSTKAYIIDGANYLNYLVSNKISEKIKKANTPTGDLAALIEELTEAMRSAASELNFELAARYRDEIRDLKKELNQMLRVK